MTSFFELWRIAVGALRANWFRAALTALGVVIGVASLIAVTAVSAGAQAQVSDSIRRLGGNVIKVDGEFIAIGTAQSATDRTITPDDIAAISKLPAVTATAPHQDIESIVVSTGRQQANTWLVGMTPEYANVQNQRIIRGRNISSADVAFGRDVIVLGTVAAFKLFKGEDPIGKIVRISSTEFEVIGIQDRRGKLADENLDNRIFVPLPVALRVLLGGVNVVHVDLRVRSEADIEPTIDDTDSILRDNHKLPASYPDDFSVEDQASIVKEAQRATGTFRLLTFALGGIALLVGGIGIMNMMLVVHADTRMGSASHDIRGRSISPSRRCCALGGWVTATHDARRLDDRAVAHRLLVALGSSGPIRAACRPDAAPSSGYRRNTSIWSSAGTRRGRHRARSSRTSLSTQRLLAWLPETNGVDTWAEMLRILK